MLAGRCKKLRNHVQPDAHYPVSHDVTPRLAWPPGAMRPDPAEDTHPCSRNQSDPQSKNVGGVVYNAMNLGSVRSACEFILFTTVSAISRSGRSNTQQLVFSSLEADI